MVVLNLSHKTRKSEQNLFVFQPLFVSEVIKLPPGIVAAYIRTYNLETTPLATAAYL